MTGTSYSMGLMEMWTRALMDTSSTPTCQWHQSHSSGWFLLWAVGADGMRQSSRTVNPQWG
jgi:hypothetical protein